MSTDLYKLYENDLLVRLDNPCSGYNIDEVSYVAPTSNRSRVLHYLVDIRVDFSCACKRYLLRPVKGVFLQIILNGGQMEEEDLAVTMNGVTMPVLEEIMHMSIHRSADTQRY